jgi:hypothetical protein
MRRLIFALALLSVTGLAGAVADTSQANICIDRGFGCWPLDPNEYPLQAGTFLAAPEEEIEETANSPVTRCKTQRFSATWTQATLYNVLRYEGQFRVCYRHGVEIVSVLHRSGDSTYTRWPWNWKGNDAGYPFHIRYLHRVEFYFRGTLEFCPVSFGCTTTKHPFVTVTFFDNNTMDKDLGVG